MRTTELVNEIKTSFNYCENNINKIIDSQKYSKGSMFSTREINQYIGILNKWKEHSPNDKNCFQRLINLSNIIKMKNYENFRINNDKIT